MDVTIAPRWLCWPLRCLQSPATVSVALRHQHPHLYLWCLHGLLWYQEPWALPALSSSAPGDQTRVAEQPSEVSYALSAGAPSPEPAILKKTDRPFLFQKLTISDSSWQGAFYAQVCSPCSNLVWDYRSCMCYHACWEFMNAAAFLCPQDTFLLCSSATWDTYYFSIFLVIPEPLDERV